MMGVYSKMSQPNMAIPTGFLIRSAFICYHKVAPMGLTVPVGTALW
jgi:hypothetical protein